MWTKALFIEVWQRLVLYPWAPLVNEILNIFIVLGQSSTHDSLIVQPTN